MKKLLKGMLIVLFIVLMSGCASNKPSIPIDPPPTPQGEQGNEGSQTGTRIKLDGEYWADNGAKKACKLIKFEVDLSNFNLPAGANIEFRYDFGDGSAPHFRTHSSTEYVYRTAGKYEATIEIYVDGVEKPNYKKVLTINVEKGKDC